MHQTLKLDDETPTSDNISVPGAVVFPQLSVWVESTTGTQQGGVVDAPGSFVMVEATSALVAVLHESGRLTLSRRLAYENKTLYVTVVA